MTIIIIEILFPYLHTTVQMVPTYYVRRIESAQLFQSIIVNNIFCVGIYAYIGPAVAHTPINKK